MCWLIKDIVINTTHVALLSEQGKQLQINLDKSNTTKMPLNPELMSAEDEIKVKYTGIIKTMSHTELKSFDKTKYQKLALTELKHVF